MRYHLLIISVMLFAVAVFFTTSLGVSLISTASAVKTPDETDSKNKFDWPLRLSNSDNLHWKKYASFADRR